MAAEEVVATAQEKGFLDERITNGQMSPEKVRN